MELEIASQLVYNEQQTRNRKENGELCLHMYFMFCISTVHLKESYIRFMVHASLLFVVVWYHPILPLSLRGTVKSLI